MWYRECCEIIKFRWTFNFGYFVDMAIHQFNIATKYLITSVILHKIWNPQIQVHKNMSNIIRPRNVVSMKLNALTVNIVLLGLFSWCFLSLRMQRELQTRMKEEKERSTNAEMNKLEEKHKRFKWCGIFVSTLSKKRQYIGVAVSVCQTRALKVDNNFAIS